MRLVLHLPEKLARRVEEVAAERGMTAEQVAVEAIQDRLGASGTRQPAPGKLKPVADAVGVRHQDRRR